jgi:hypothetical protein
MFIEQSSDYLSKEKWNIKGNLKLSYELVNYDFLSLPFCINNITACQPDVGKEEQKFWNRTSVAVESKSS